MEGEQEMGGKKEEKSLIALADQACYRSSEERGSSCGWNGAFETGIRGPEGQDSGALVRKRKDLREGWGGSVLHRTGLHPNPFNPGLHT